MVKYYYLRDQEARPIVTVCLFNEDGFTSKGIAICSEKDQPNKKIGREIALGRAIKAFAKDTTENLIQRKRAIEQMKKVASHWSPWKTNHNPVLTPYEKKILAKPEETTSETFEREVSRP